jgi:hypothetical protein
MRRKLPSVDYRVIYNVKGLLSLNNTITITVLIDIHILILLPPRSRLCPFRQFLITLQVIGAERLVAATGRT